MRVCTMNDSRTLITLIITNADRRSGRPAPRVNLLLLPEV